MLTKGAMQLRNDIKQQDISQVGPPDMENSVSVIPESVTLFLHTLLTRDGVRWLTNSFGSDLVYAVTCGKTKPPFAVKSLTGNTELIQILNRLGHSLSYSQIEEVNKAQCLQKLERSVDDVPLPGDIYPFVFITLAWDNIDRLEETVSGEGTSHRVNGIAVQTKIVGLCQNKSSMQLLSPRRGVSFLQRLNHPPTMLVSEWVHQMFKCGCRHY